MSGEEASFRGWSQLSGELRFSDTPSGVRELRPPVGTYADAPSQTGIKSALLEVDAGRLPRLSTTRVCWRPPGDWGVDGISDFFPGES